MADITILQKSFQPQALEEARKPLPSDLQKKVKDISNHSFSNRLSNVHVTEQRRYTVIKEGSKLRLVTDRGVVTLKEVKKVTIPHDGKLKLMEWLSKHQSEHATTKGRVQYQPEDVEKAFQEFEEKYHCSWAEMKHHCTNDATLQIINDLRASYLEEMFDELREEFKGDLKKISDFGSSKLTSDRDFSFSVGADRQTKEAKIVARFNERFEKVWNAPSATVFDSNAYTMQYVLAATDPQMEEKRSQKQQMGSLLMKMRTASPEGYQAFKEECLNRLGSGQVCEKKAQEFENVERLNDKLNVLLQQQIVRMELGDNNAAVSHLLTRLPEDLIGSEKVELSLLVDALKEKDPQIEIKASNALHDHFKAHYEKLEERKLTLFNTNEHLALSDDAGQFLSQFNDQLDQLIKDAKTDEEKSKFQGLKLGNEEAMEVMDIFKERAQFEKLEMQTNGDRRSLEGVFIQTTAKLNRIQELQTEINQGGKSSDLKALNTQLEQLQNDVKVLTKEYGARSSQDLIEKMQMKMTTLDKEITDLSNKKKQLQQLHGEYWDLCGAFKQEEDRLLIEMQDLNIQGMCFAQEAHVSEGAFGFVVLNIQAGVSDVRTPSQYVQAFREISGFYSGHQLHEKTPQGRMVEGSKYAERLMVAIDKVKERSKALNVPLPQLNESKLSQLGKFFKKIAPLRGKGLSQEKLQEAVNKSAKDVKLNGENEAFSNATVDQINREVESISATLEAWISTLPVNKQNAYYQVG